MEFIGDKSVERAVDYAGFLGDCGYRVFYKNINLNWSVGKVVARPWAEPVGRLATSETTFNRELLIVEKKKRQGSFFSPHYLRRHPKLLPEAAKALAVSVSAHCRAGNPDAKLVWGILGLIALFGLIPIQIALGKLKKIPGNKGR